MSKKQKNNDLLQVAVESAINASQLIMNAFDSPRTIDYKGKTDLVTETDYKSENLIKSIIKSFFPEHSFLAEESGKEIKTSDYLWVIDPLDGTTNFVHGYPSFAVSIALYYRKIPKIGVVLEMPNTKLYSAINGEGSWCEGEPITCSNTKELINSLMVTGFGYNHNDNWKKNMLLFKKFTDESQGVRRLGSAAVDLCHLAAGKVDAFWEFDLKPWDTAAGFIIAKEAGAVVTQLDGSDFSIYDNTILATNPFLHQIIKEKANLII